MASRQPATTRARSPRAKTSPAKPATGARAARPPGGRALVPVRRAAAAPRLGQAGTQARDGIARSLKGLLSIEAEIAALVRKTVADGLDAGGATTRELAAVVRDVVAGAIQATEQTGTALVVSVRGVARGVVMGVHDVRADVTKAASETVKLAVRHATMIGADVELVIRRAIDGISQATGETGGNVAQIVKTVAGGALRAAGQTGNLLTLSVTRSLEDMAGGLEKIGKPASTARPPARRAGGARAGAVRAG